MPAKSKAQWRLMEAIAHGSAHVKGLTKKQAEEYIHGQNPKGLPEHTTRKARHGKR